VNEKQSFVKRFDTRLAVVILIVLVGTGLIVVGGISLMADIAANDVTHPPTDFAISDVSVTAVPPTDAAPNANGQAVAANPKASPTIELTPASQNYLPAVKGGGGSGAGAAAQTPATASATPLPQPAATALPIDVPTRIVIPSVKLDAPVEAVGTIRKAGETVDEWDVPDGRVAGWQDTSARLGQIGNLVLNGHHNINGMVFGRLKDLTPGDTINIYGDHQVVTYEVIERKLLLEAGQSLSVRLQHAQYIEPTGDERLTLVTCWPPRGNAYRLILIAHPVKQVMLSPTDVTAKQQ
jgi:LPXTG-site transpeptidase (sortase) family protein